ncbi:MAG: DUF1287 domain-containing protein [Clostridia bacterium]
MNKKYICIIVVTVVVCAMIYIFLKYQGILPEKTYLSADFNISVIKSEKDCNNNGIDDYTDILLGAKKDAENKPTYKSDSYTIGGYPPDNIGVCTDVIWSAFKNAGYSLKDMIDNDISQNLPLYTNISKPDSNIDFRRVKNLKVFFQRHAQTLTNNIYEIDKWQPGDIVIFGKTYTHIGIISDKRNSKGVSYLLHNSGQPKREEDIIEFIINFNEITGHYRWTNV